MFDLSPNGVARDQVEQTALYLIARSGSRIHALVERANAAIGIAIDTADSYRYLLIFREKADLWMPPTIMTGTATGAIRPTTTTPPTYIADRCFASSSIPKTVEESPTDISWLAVSGTAAQDAISVEVASSIETTSVDVGDDGFFFALIMAKWGERIHTLVQTRDGCRVPIPN